VTGPDVPASDAGGSEATAGALPRDGPPATGVPAARSVPSGAAGLLSPLAGIAVDDAGIASLAVALGGVGAGVAGTGGAGAGGAVTGEAAAGGVGETGGSASARASNVDSGSAGVGDTCGLAIMGFGDFGRAWVRAGEAGAGAGVGGGDSSITRSVMTRGGRVGGVHAGAKLSAPYTRTCSRAEAVTAAARTVKSLFNVSSPSAG